MDASDGVIVPIDADINSVSCKACDIEVDTTFASYLQNHVYTALHNETIAEYAKIMENGGMENFAQPYAAARCKYFNKSMYQYLTQHDIADVEVRLIPTNIGGKLIYDCIYFCKLCEISINKKNCKAAIEAHLKSRRHKKDSRGNTFQNYSLDLCKVCIERKCCILKLCLFLLFHKTGH